jgi:hypothetical protein
MKLEAIKMSPKLMASIMFTVQHGLAEISKGNDFDMSDVMMDWQLAFDENDDICIINPPSYLVHADDLVDAEESPQEDDGEA